MKHANVYQRGERLFVRTLSQTTAGVLIGSGEFEVLDMAAPATALGEAVRSALEASNEGLPHPSPADWPGISRVFLNGVGVKSMSAFMKGARCVGVVSNGGMLRLEPLRNGGTRDGFLELTERRFEIRATSSVEAIGQAVQKALALSE